MKLPAASPPGMPRPTAARAVGALSSVMKDHLYWFGTRGFVFTSPWVDTPATRRQAAVLLFGTRGRLRVSAGGQQLEHGAVAVAPLAVRGLRARDCGLVSVHVFPPHPAYRRFRALPTNLMALARAPLREFDAGLESLYRGELAFHEARELFDALVERVSRQLPAAGARTDGGRLHALLMDKPQCSLAELARMLGLSYTGASRHFSRTVGLSLRSYELWLKYYLASDLRMRGASWTEAALLAGFTDSAHLAHTWQVSYGFSPSYARDPRRVQVFRDEERATAAPVRA